VFLVAFSAHSGAGEPGQFGTGEWPSYGADTANSKYAPLDQINKDNVKELHIAWRWSSVENAILTDNSYLWTMVNEATPLMIDGRLYTSTSLSQVAAIDAVTGQTLWVYDPQTYRRGSPPGLGFVHRGVAYWADGETPRLFIGTGDAYLIALDAKTGQPIPEFGEKGRIDLTQGLHRRVDRMLYGVTSPPIICRNVVVVGASITDYPQRKDMPPGDVRGFDVRTGQQRWVFHAVPQGDEPGVETWEDDAWQYTGNTNVWTVMSCDEQLGYVYLPFSTPTNDYYGGQRPGNNLFAESLVALEAETGKSVWHFQMVHHGLWDYDLPAAPNLVDITVAGQRIKAVAQVTKQGFCYVFDRVTGTPVWPIEERLVPQSTVPGEKTSATQPFPTRPLPFEQQGITLDDVIDFTPALRREARRILDKYEYGPLFTPPTEQGTIVLPGVAGGGRLVWRRRASGHGRAVCPVVHLTDDCESQETRGWGFSLYLYRVHRIWSRRPPGVAPGQATVWPDHGHQPEHGRASLDASGGRGPARAFGPATPQSPAPGLAAAQFFLVDALVALCGAARDPTWYRAFPKKECARIWAPKP
jgi:quinoprotein glucose dehydrogenase